MVSRAPSTEQVLNVMGSGVKIWTPENNQAADAVPLVLINGLGANHLHWGRFPGLLDRTVIAVDVVRNGDKGSMKLFANNLFEVADTLEHDLFDLGGQSWGGFAAQSVALRDQRRINKLVLIGTGPGMLCVPPSLRAVAAMRSPKRSLASAGSIFGGEIGQLLQHRREDLSIDELGNVKSIETMMAREIDPEKYQLQMEAVKQCAHHIMTLTGLLTPTLILVGQKDPIARPMNSRVMNCLIPNSQLHIEDKVGHDIVYSRAQGCAHIVDSFLGRQPKHTK